MGPKWVFIWVIYGQTIRDMRDLQHGSMLDPHGQSIVGTMWELYGSSMGKINPHLPSRKKQKKKRKNLLHIFTQMIMSQVPVHLMDVRSQMREAYVHVQFIAHAYNQDALKLKASFLTVGNDGFVRIYILPLNFKSSRDIRVKIKT